MLGADSPSTDGAQNAGRGATASGQPHLGDEVGQVPQRVVDVVLRERWELEVLAHLGRDR
jgi:hypothetical protein